MRRMIVFAVVSVIAIPSISRAADPKKSPSRGAEENQQDSGNEQSSSEAESEDEKGVDVPAVRVRGQKEQPKANDPVGGYEQPRWTVRRPFSVSRVYVNPSGYAEFNFFFTPEFALAEPSDAGITSEYELEVGLGKRLQFDLYLVTGQMGWGGPFGVVEEKLELRYAFADWGEIWGNPTLYFEWAHGHAPIGADTLNESASVSTDDTAGGGTTTEIEFREFESSPTEIEPKLLLGGNMGDALFGAANFVYEQPIGGGESEREFGLSGGLAYLAVDPELFLGGDVESEMELEEGEVHEVGAFAGPSVQWYPSEPVHVGFSALFGTELEKEEGEEGEDGESGFESEGVSRLRLIVGYEF